MEPHYVQLKQCWINILYFKHEVSVIWEAQSVAVIMPFTFVPPSGFLAVHCLLEEDNSLADQSFVGFSSSTAS